MGPVGLWTTAALLATAGRLAKNNTRAATQSPLLGAVDRLNRLNAESCGCIGDNDACGGGISLFVVGGEEAAEGQFPWAASIQYPGRGGTRAPNCGGSQISNR
jgi:hypothetical protein